MNDEILAYTKLLLVKVTLGVYLVRPVVSSPTKKKKKKLTPNSFRLRN